MTAPQQDALTQLQAQIKSIHEQGGKAVIKGHGSKQFLIPASHRQTTATILDTTALTGVVDYQPSELVITVYGGTSLTQLEAILAEHNQYLPFDAPRYAQDGIKNPSEPMHANQAKTGTVGGAVATALSGSRRASYGAIRDFVLGLQIIDGQGRLLNFGGQVIKNVAGYDVSRFLCGSWGRLGLISQVSFRVLPRPKADTTLHLLMPIDHSIPTINRWVGAALPIAASAMLPIDKAYHALWLRLCGNHAAVDYAHTQINATIQSFGITTKASPSDIWPQLDNCQDGGLFLRSLIQSPTPLPTPHEGLKKTPLWRLTLPINTAHDFVEKALGSKPTEEHATTSIQWHGGLRWVAADISPKEACAIAASVGGAVIQYRALRPDSLPPWSGNPLSANPAIENINQNIQKVFDPKGIFSL